MFRASHETVVDSHVHLFAGDSIRFPLAPDAPYRPRATLSPRRLVRSMTRARVGMAIAVQPEPYGSDHRYLQTCVSAAPDRLRAVGLARYPGDDPAVQVGDLVRDFGTALVGMRAHLSHPHSDPPPSWLAELGEATRRHQLFVQILGEAPRIIAAIESLTPAGPPVVIDHMAHIRPAEEGAMLEALADAPATVVKLSEVHRQSDGEPIPTRRTAAERALSAFGPARTLVGSGYQGRWTSRQYRRVIDDYRAIVGSLGPADRRAVLSDNARRLLS